ncbi:unnamed protein product [Urochloa humidicola]
MPASPPLPLPRIAAVATPPPRVQIRCISALAHLIRQPTTAGISPMAGAPKSALFPLLLTVTASVLPYSCSRQPAMDGGLPCSAPQRSSPARRRRGVELEDEDGSRRPGRNHRAPARLPTGRSSPPEPRHLRNCPGPSSRAASCPQVAAVKPPRRRLLGRRLRSWPPSTLRPSMAMAFWRHPGSVRRRPACARAVLGRTLAGGAAPAPGAVGERDVAREG